MILFDVAPIGAGIGIGLAVFFFLICAVVAFIAYKMLRRTVKMAVRMMIVGIILAVAMVGGIALIYISVAPSPGPKGPPIRNTR